jgi:hypothetical protein
MIVTSGRDSLKSDELGAGMPTYHQLIEVKRCSSYNEESRVSNELPFVQAEVVSRLVSSQSRHKTYGGPGERGGDSRGGAQDNGLPD